MKASTLHFQNSSVLVKALNLNSVNDRGMFCLVLRHDHQKALQPIQTNL